MRVRSRRIIIGLLGRSESFLFLVFNEWVDPDHFFFLLTSVSILDVVVVDHIEENCFYFRCYLHGSSPMYVHSPLKRRAHS